MSAKSFLSNFIAVSTRAWSLLVSLTYLLLDTPPAVKVALLNPCCGPAAAKDEHLELKRLARRNVVDAMLAIAVFVMMDNCTGKIELPGAELRATLLNSIFRICHAFLCRGLIRWSSHTSKSSDI